LGQIKPFNFKGQISSSKSLLNRCLILKSFYPNFNIEGFSECLDVLKMQKAVEDFQKAKTHFDCGSAGTTFRFLMARLSREGGSWNLICEKRLLERPQEPLYAALNQLGVEVNLISDTQINIQSKGWIINGPIKLDLDQSSQFLSALLLSAWELQSDLRIILSEERNSYSYLDLTIKWLSLMGMEIKLSGNEIFVPKKQKLKTFKYNVEPDMSSTFALTAHAVVNGNLWLENFPPNSLQPDFYFLEILKKISAKYHLVKSDFPSSDAEQFILKIEKTENLNPLEINLKDQPDLFPVLSVLLSRVEGVSRLFGIKLLQFKESNRLQNTKLLLDRLDIKTELFKDHFVIFGKKNHIYSSTFDFDPDQDHRMAMAASLAIHQGAKIKILNKDVVNKSFPEFWDIVNL
jgi:3-phosphoshikimate 1-carboxyvinyltransferase